MRRAIFPGSFDPFTLGHANLVERGLKMFDSLVIGIGYNEHKQGWIPVDERVRALTELYHGEPRVSVVKYSNLTTDFAREMEADFILRGIRSVKDYEYELSISDVNHRLSGIETIILFTQPELASLSSSVVRELAHFGHPIEEWLPNGLHYNLTNNGNR